jgi:hypothetical protein
MISPYCERAIEDALHYGNALLKFISPNNAGLTGGHECGFYLPKGVWQMYTPHPPVKGRLDKHPVSILWQDGRTTNSVVTWYGDKTRSEYRLTRFGRDFPFLNEDVVGDLLVLIAKSRDEFLAYVLDYDEDIAEIQSALGVEAFEHWGAYRDGVPQQVETEDSCIDRKIREFSAALTDFPTGAVFSQTTRDILVGCLKKFPELEADEALVRAYQTEYQIFQSVERQVCQNEVSGRLFKNIDDFLHTAASIMNRRKARAGRSFENHVEYLLIHANIPHKMRPALGAHILIHRFPLKSCLSSDSRRPARIAGGRCSTKGSGSRQNTSSRCSRASRARSSRKCTPPGSPSSFPDRCIKASRRNAPSVFSVWRASYRR